MKRIFVVALCFAVGVSAATGGDGDAGLSTLGGRLESRAAELSVELELLDIYRRLGEDAKAADLEERIHETVDRCREVLDLVDSATGRPVERPEPEGPVGEPAPEPPDRRLEVCREYAEGRVQLRNYDEVVKVLVSRTSEAHHRDAAAKAIVARLRNVPGMDPSVEKLKRDIGRELGALLNAREPEDRARIDGIFRSFWPGQYRRIGGDPEGPYRERYKRYKAWKKFLGE